MTKFSGDYFRALLEFIEGKHLTLGYGNDLNPQSKQCVSTISVFENLLRGRMEITVVLNCQTGILPKEIANAKVPSEFGPNT